MFHKSGDDLVTFTGRRMIGAAKNMRKCNHESFFTVRYTDSLGRDHVRDQCQLCGSSLRWIKKNGIDDINSLPSWDESIEVKWNELNQNEYLSSRQLESDEWWEKYNQYLKSEQWIRLRHAAFMRDNFLCQGCLIRFESHQLHCHHLSYDGYNRLGKSFLFEVTTLCRRCHDEFHQKF